MLFENRSKNFFSLSTGYLMFEFDKFWLAEKPKDIMEFNRVKNKFQKKIIHMLKDRTVSLRGSFNSKQYSYTSTL